MLLLLLTIVPAKDYFREWRGYQNQYLRSDPRPQRRQSRSPGGFRAACSRSGLPELGVVDRCTTCHVALRETSLVDVKAQPFRPHPPIPHKLTEFGCVLCHRGQGAATTVEEAHSSYRILGKAHPARRATWKPAAASAISTGSRERHS